MLAWSLNTSAAVISGLMHWHAEQITSRAFPLECLSRCIWIRPGGQKPILAGEFPTFPRSMKRSLIVKLLASDQLATDLETLLPADPSRPGVYDARAILEAVVSKHRGPNADPLAVFRAATGDADVAALPDADQDRAFALLRETLTSKAGRPKTSQTSRQEQNAAAQARRRQKLSREGMKQLNIWIDPDAAAYLTAIQEFHNCDSQAEALELVLRAVRQGQILPLAKT